MVSKNHLWRNFGDCYGASTLLSHFSDRHHVAPPFCSTLTPTNFNRLFSSFPRFSCPYLCFVMRLLPASWFSLRIWSEITEFDESPKGQYRRIFVISWVIRVLGVKTTGIVLLETESSEIVVVSEEGISTGIWQS